MEDDPSLAETQQDPIEDADAPGGIGETTEQDQEQQSRFNEDRALVLIGRRDLDLASEPAIADPPQERVKPISSNQGGIDLPGFVRKRTTEIRDSLANRQNSNSPLMRHCCLPLTVKSFGKVQTPHPSIG